MERSSIFHGKTHYFNGHVENSYVSLPEGKDIKKNSWGREKQGLGLRNAGEFMINPRVMAILHFGTVTIMRWI